MSPRIYCPADARFYVILDETQVFPDDPGAGTPAMVYGPGGAQATLNAAVNMGELTADSGETVDVPRRVQDWLWDEVQPMVDEMFEEALA